VTAGKFKQLKRKSRIGQVVVVLVAVELLFFCAYTAIKLPVATQGNLRRYFHNLSLQFNQTLPAEWQVKMEKQFPALLEPAVPVRESKYVPLAPLAILLGYVLGPVLGLVAGVIYLLLGLIGPLFGLYAFASGGGGQYVIEPGFGYLLGMVAAIWACGRITLNCRTSVRQLIGLLVGLVIIHVSGIVYMLSLCLLKSMFDSASTLVWQQWVFEEIRNKTWYCLPFDVVFSLVAIALGFPVRWLMETLIAPDIGQKNKQAPAVKEIV
jgi:biotin transport system substrate-specific component